MTSPNQKDIDKLIESLEFISKINLDYINWIFSDKCVKITVNNDTSCQVVQLNVIENVNLEITNIHYIDKNVIFKCFDVISYVLNKMYEESSSFLSYDIESYQINL